MHTVRQANPEDRTAVAASVAAAFAHDPAWAYLLSDDYARLAPHFAAALFEDRVGSGDVWVSGDLAAVAMWVSPEDGGGSSTGAEHRWGAYRAVAGSAVWDRHATYGRAVHAARPTTPFWYLGVLATHPDRQAQGLATAVMAPVLERADRDAIDCCLETSTATNRKFYERRGFTDATDVHIAGGPETWWLRRAPQAPSARA